MPSLAHASRRAQLQHALGDVGEVLPRRARGGEGFRAAGWYAKVGEELVYLGDHTGVAYVTIARLLEKPLPEEAAGLRRSPSAGSGKGDLAGDAFPATSGAPRPSPALLARLASARRARAGSHAT